MKFAIIITVALEKIDEEIQEYIQQNGHFVEPYLFMSEDTAKAIEAEVAKNIYTDSLPNKKNTKDGVYATYTGYKIFINNDLKFGIVEIR